MIRHAPAPAMRAWAMKSSVISVSTCPRTTRAYRAQRITEIAITTLPKLGPTVTARISARRITGNDSVASVTRMSVASTRPP